MKAIETHYKGYRFRSRLEARWAKFFDELGAEWLYEDEGYELPSGWYLPDFSFAPLFPNVYSRVFIEVKGVKPSITEIQKCKELAEGLSAYCAIVQGVPGDRCKTYEIFVPDSVSKTTAKCVESVTESDILGELSWAFFLMEIRTNGAKSIEQAATAARSARFEHGECPA